MRKRSGIRSAMRAVIALFAGHLPSAGAYPVQSLLVSNRGHDLLSDTGRRAPRAPRRDRARAARARARGQRHRRRRPARCLRDGRADGVPAAAARGRAPGVDGRGRGDPALRRPRGREGRAARRRHFAVGRRDTGGRCDRRRPRQVQSHTRNRLREPLRRRAVAASPTSQSATRSRREGFYYAPDPSSQIACTIGGNVAENSGGVHCLKYGLTTNNVLGVELVTPDGEIVRLGGKHLDSGQLRSARSRRRLRGPARHRHRGHGADPAAAADCARAADRLRRRRSRGRLRGGDHRGRASCRPAWR